MTWDAFLTQENFHLAWRRIRNSQITTTKDRLGLKVFSQSLDVHIERLIQDLQQGIYEPQTPSVLYLPKKSKRLRPFTLLHMRDRLVYQALGNILIRNSYEDLKIYADNKVFSPVLIDIDKDFIFYPSLRKEDNEGQFLKFTKKRESLIESKQFRWVLQTDIASFYPSIDHSLLLQKLQSNNWLDRDLCMLLNQCLRIWSSNDANYQINKGLPIGYETSDLLANLFLMELDDMLASQEYIRYVDDIQIFTTSEKEAQKLLNSLDIFLQKQGLTLQGAKSVIKDLAEILPENRLQELEDQQTLLSEINRGINAPNDELQEEADKELRKLLVNELGINEWDDLDNNDGTFETVDEEVNLKEERLFFFALYRIREKNVHLRDIVLDLLTTHPHRSYAIAHYLMLFREHTIIINKLWEMVNDESIHGQVRADCLRTLYRLTDDKNTIKDVVKVWLLDDDLSLSLCAVELMQQYADSIGEFNLEVIIEKPSDKHLLYAVVSTWFLLLRSKEQQKELISWCVNQDDYMLKSLGVHFLSTNIHLLPSVKPIPSGLVEKLIKGFKDKISIENININIHRLFNIQVDFDLNKTPLRKLNQVVINMILSKETNRDEYLRSSSEFLTEFSQLYQSITNKKFISLAENSAIKDAFEYSRIGLANLSDFQSSMTFLGTKPALSYIGIEKFHDGIAQIISNAFIEFKLIFKNMPEEHQEQIINSAPKPLPLIFFSYAREDEDSRKTLAQKLAYLETQGIATLWSDRKIPAGQVWEPELETKLNEAKIVLFLMTANFFASTFIKNQEMPRSIRNYNSQSTVCIPILLEDCDWMFTPYTALQTIPTDPADGHLKPVTLWKYTDSAYKTIQMKIRQILEQLESGTFKWYPVSLKR